jgi:predicted DNA binding CopG/RHH family protein
MTVERLSKTDLADFLLSKLLLTASEFHDARKEVMYRISEMSFEDFKNAATATFLDEVTYQFFVNQIVRIMGEEGRREGVYFFLTMLILEELGWKESE